MRTPDAINLAMVRLVAEHLGELRDSVVFVGGAVVDFLITDPAAPRVRPTKDVDVIVETVSLLEYHELSDSLRRLGFKEDSKENGGPLCRWTIEGIKVDTMPVRGDVLGFSNAYYPVAVETAVHRDIAEGLTIRLISAPCFLAVKLEAFANRGLDDYMGSHDIEDVIAVVDGRPEIVDEIMESPREVKSFLVEIFGDLLERDDFLDSLPGHLEFDGETLGRVSMFMTRVEAIASMTVDAA